MTLETDEVVPDRHHRDRHAVARAQYPQPIRWSEDLVAVAVQDSKAVHRRDHPGLVASLILTSLIPTCQP